MSVIPTATARILPKRNRAADGSVANGEKRLDVNAFVPRFLLPLVWPFDVVSRAFVGGVVGIHVWLQRGVLRQLVLVALLVVAAIGLTLELWPKLEYLPEGNQNLAFAVILPPPGLNIEELTGMGQVIDAHLEPYWNTDPDSPEAASLRYPPIEHNFFVAAGRQVFMGARAYDPLRAGELVPLFYEAGGGIPGVFLFAQQRSIFAGGLTAGKSVDIEIRGPDLKTLSGLGQEIMGMVRRPDVLPTARSRPIPSLDLSSPEVHVRPRWERMADLGVTALDLGYTVNAFVDGAYAGDYFTGGDAIDLTLVGVERYAQRLQDLKDLPIATPAGSLVPLGAVADIELTSGPEQINHRERERTITIQVQPDEETPLEDAVDRVTAGIVEPLRASGRLGGDYRITLGGTADKLQRTKDELFPVLALAVLITYLLMAALFESWIYPFVVILSVPLGAVGGVLGLWILNRFTYQPLDTLTMIGFIILVGTVVNNAILIVHQALNYMREEGMDPKDAVRTSVRTRIRPIFMTLFTTVFGLAPLVLFPGAGSELYRGIGSILIGGLFVSTVFTLLLVPTLFRLLLGVRASLARLLRLESDTAASTG